jgi:hypothetical protein
MQVNLDRSLYILMALIAGCLLGITGTKVKLII